MEASLGMMDYIEDTIKKTPQKDNKTAETYRNLGNDEYAKKNFADSLRFYTRSLLFAIPSGIDYGKALANRSAATFALQEYTECLKDIEVCLATKYPDNLRAKLLLRRLQAYYHLNMDEEFFLEVEEMWDTFKDNGVFNQLRNSFKGNLLKPMYKTTEIYPKVAVMMNETFAFATNLIELKCNERQGRHVIAAQNITSGAILFQEKAFIAAQIYVSREELKPCYCYQCLRHIPYFSLPCTSCTYCLYCSERCRKISWKQGHRFECIGMGIFYDYGQLLPAFKMLVKGIQTKNIKKEATSIVFGGRVNNSPWANSLTLAASRDINIINAYYQHAKVIALYLTTRTDFYEYLDKYMDCEYDRSSFVQECLVANMMRLNNNGSALENEDYITIASGLYPSISMMNHSCKCNITIDYDGVIAIVRAKEDIPKGGEVFNCYGIDFNADRKTRRKYLKDTYNFDCFCSYCTEEQSE